MDHKINGRTYKIVLFPGKRRLELQRKWSQILMPSAGHLAGAIRIELGDGSVSDIMNAQIRALSLNGDQVAAAAGLLAGAPESLILETFDLTYAVMMGQKGFEQEFKVKDHFDAVFKEAPGENGSIDHYADLYPLLIAVIRENFGPLLQSLKELLGPIGSIFKHKKPSEPIQKSPESSEDMPQL